MAVEAQFSTFLHNDLVPINLYALAYNACKISPLGSGLKVVTEATELHTLRVPVDHAIEIPKATMAIHIRCRAVTPKDPA